MIGTREICALLLGGAVGVGGTVAVHKVSPKPPVAKAKGKPGVPQASRPRVVRPEPALRPASPTILDCPTPAPGSPWAAIPTIPVPLPPMGGAGAAAFPGGGGGAGAHPYPPAPPSSAVPELAAWAMMVSGFGLVGAAMRRRPAGAGA